jgi:hypothetical protein
LKGAIFITNYYIDVVKALGVFNKVDFEIEDETAPTYLRTDALIKLHHGKAVRSIKILENLQQKYNLYDKYTSEILIAAFLMAKDYSNAFATIGMLQFEQEDPDAKFLSAVQLIQTLKLNGALQFLKFKYEGDLIDFRIVGFEEYLESL